MSMPMCLLLLLLLLQRRPFVPAVRGCPADAMIPLDAQSASMLSCELLQCCELYPCARWVSAAVPHVRLESVSICGWQKRLRSKGIAEVRFLFGCVMLLTTLCRSLLPLTYFQGQQTQTDTNQPRRHRVTDICTGSWDAAGRLFACLARSSVRSALLALY